MPRLAIAIAAVIALGSAPLAPAVAGCAAGPRRAGCVGPNGAAAVAHRPVVAPATRVCAAGDYRAGCVGPNGAAAVSRPAAPATVNCAAGVYRAGCVGPNGTVVRAR